MYIFRLFSCRVASLPTFSSVCCQIQNIQNVLFLSFPIKEDLFPTNSVYSEVTLWIWILLQLVFSKGTCYTGEISQKPVKAYVKELKPFLMHQDSPMTSLSSSQSKQNKNWQDIWWRNITSDQLNNITATTAVLQLNTGQSVAAINTKAWYPGTSIPPDVMKQIGPACWISYCSTEVLTPGLFIVTTAHVRNNRRRTTAQTHRTQS